MTELKITDKGFVSIKEWSAYNGVEYNDTIRVLKKHKKTISRFGKTSMFLATELDLIMGYEINDRQIKSETKSNYLKTLIEKREDNNRVMVSLNDLGWKTEEISKVLNIIKSNKDICDKILDKNKDIKIP